MITTVLSPQPHLNQRGREVQEFGRLRLLPIALSADARRHAAELTRIERPPEGAEEVTCT